MSDPQSHFFAGEPRLHYLEWNPGARSAIVLLHGNSANAWWWRMAAEPIAAAGFRLLALDFRGHGDSEWVRPAAYSPKDYADDLARFIEGIGLRRPLVAGHSMGGIAALAFALRHDNLARAAVAIDIAITSGRRRNRFLQRLKSLPTVIYPDLETAIARFRLMPDEGDIPQGVLAEIAAKSLGRTGEGGYTMKFDRESFFGSDGLEVPDAVKRIRIPLLLVRAEKSRIMTAEAAAAAAESNPMVRIVTIPAAHHHVPLESPRELADVIVGFAESVRQ